MPEDRYESYRHVTDFNQSNFNGLKDMLDGADPEVLYAVAQHWQDLADALETHKKSFSKAVDDVMEHWQGESAERFQKRAQQIIANFESGKPWCTHTARVMDESAQALQTAIDKVRTKDESWDIGDLNDWGWSISDDELDEALKRGESAKGLLEANKDDLDDEQTLRLESTIAMEQLGSSFVRASKALKAPAPGSIGRDDKVPDHQKDPSNDPGAINTPMIPTGGGPKGGGGGLKLPSRRPSSGSTPKMPSPPSLKHPGVSGGLGELKPKGPSVGTGLDGLHDGPSGGLKAPSGSPGGGGLHAPSGGGPGGGPGLSGMPGGMPGAGGLKSAGSGGLKGSGPGGLKSGGPGGLKGGAPGISPGGTQSGGRAGMPGMAGAHGGGAGKGAGGGGVSSGGAQARQKGGIIGSPGGRASGGAQGGSGLHRSRGGTAGSDSGGGRRPAGMMGGAHGAPGARGEGGGGDASRPDYLVEDEETWTSKRNVAPPVIE
ncbi:WXG100 family type VII secretion target [Streptomyces sp. Je 1-4]|uniref:WXG100 family type VII secretion target n=1 Tax=Streptomyces TaxID=1883 RepID=UPI0021DB523B|nr:MULTISPECIES: WXG100 family type VII secretion target [unclassified Streptomyces]UYB39631.1 WXG100 family type VII secretion target [Streptomyces sp. Je 1-4]UZQ35675.1 WXG100 family type VII secretion target [Streptomyces sp. Je 1-4] [Streptomyces sp. Je 1-4 4N24]UZQ43093.1 WXG100 family type VII secretion target [Streptomyces sp. Je 1-4] [Streptomyces sp. Je 1-4 4N24_ara]